MEFEHVGSHCSLPSCKQKDFLPFTCDSCQQQYCLSHRSYEAHGCDGALKKDITSLDCPICGKSVKFDKTKDPNEMWEDHYAFFCAKQTNPATARSEQCARKGCTNHLGPSNTYQCPKCLKKVCLSHRMSDEHDCVQTNHRPTVPVKRPVSTTSNIAPSKAPAPVAPPVSSNPREAFLQRVEAKGGLSSGKRPTNSSQSKPSTTAKPAPVKSVPLSQPASSSSAGQSFICPMCGVDCNNLNNLSRHVENHLMNESNTSSQPQQTPHTLPEVSSTQSNLERCPICNSQFADAIALVNHVETVHSDNATRSPTTQQTEGSNCVLT